MIQVFRHFGRTGGASTGKAGTGGVSGDGGSGTAAGDVSIVEPSWVLEDGVAGGATHLVHTVEVMVLTIVDTVFEVWTIRVVPDVTVSVTGHVVTVVWTL